jgi:RNA polymerase primary sigma factor
MKEELRSSEDIEIRTALAPDVDADDAKASGMLGMIGRAEAEESQAEDKPQSAMRTSHGASPFLLESLYFRSFGERGLLTREEEIAIAKRIDHGTRRIRTALRQAVRTLLKSKRTSVPTEAVKVLQVVRRLSGLSATALDNAVNALATALKPPQPNS